MKKHIDDTKQKELENYLLECDVYADELCDMLKEGIPKELDGRKEFDGAFRKGLYLGSPGKDIYFNLPKLGMSEIRMVANAMAMAFPVVPPSDHIAYAACVRYIYGCFDKQGCLLSEGHKNMMSEMDEDWSLSDLFMSIFVEECKAQDKMYGVVIYHEMAGHRIRDRLVIENNRDHIKPMLDHYNESQRIALQIDCLKHTFTPFYWGACYLEEFDPTLAIHYHKKAVKNMERYCPDTREGYKSKASHSIMYIKKNAPKNQWKEFKKWLYRCKNPCIIKSRRKFIK